MNIINTDERHFSVSVLKRDGNYFIEGTYRVEDEAPLVRVNQGPFTSKVAAYEADQAILRESIDEWSAYLKTMEDPSEMLQQALKETAEEDYFHPAEGHPFTATFSIDIPTMNKDYVHKAGTPTLFGYHPEYFSMKHETPDPEGFSIGGKKGDTAREWEYISVVEAAEILMQDVPVWVLAEREAGPRWIPLDSLTCALKSKELDYFINNFQDMLRLRYGCDVSVGVALDMEGNDVAIQFKDSEPPVDQREFSKFNLNHFISEVVLEFSSVLQADTDLKATVYYDETEICSLSLTHAR